MNLLRYAAGTALALVVAGYPFLALTYSTGAPAGFSGPEQDCSACHNSFPVNSGTGSVTITAPPTFTPGVPVPITVTVVNTTPPNPDVRQGFELSTRDAATPATRVGTYVVDGTTVQNAQGSPDYVTHTEAGNALTTWSFNWVPPAVAPEQVRMYAAGNATDGNGNPTEDYIYTTSVTIDRSTVAGEAGPEALALRVGAVSPNPVRRSAVVAVTLAESERLTARIVDAAGRTLRTVADAQAGAGASMLRVSTAGMSAGPYLLVVEAGGARVTRRFTVVR
jgi:hypothetical protein